MLTQKVNLWRLKRTPTCCWSPAGVQIQLLTLQPNWTCPLSAESPDWSGPCWAAEGWALSGLKRARTASSRTQRPRGRGWAGGAWPAWKCSGLWRWSRQRRVIQKGVSQQRAALTVNYAILKTDVCSSGCWCSCNSWNIVEDIKR